MIKLLLYSVFALILICQAAIAKAQSTDNSSTFRNIYQKKYFRLHYDNDYFTKTDQYYTQRITLAYVHPAIKKIQVTRLLLKPFNTQSQYGISFNLFGYTPTSILSDSILYGDRPFNANISLKIFSIQVDEIHKQQISAALSVGVTGPAALGYDIQYNIHRWLKIHCPMAGSIKPKTISSSTINYITKSNYLVQEVIFC